MGGVYKCERCGALRHKSAICRSANAFVGECSICGAYDHLVRQWRTGLFTRMHANAMFGSGIGVPGQGAWLQQQGGLVMHGDSGEAWGRGGEGGGAQFWAGAGESGGAQHWARDGEGGGEQHCTGGGDGGGAQH